MYFVLLCEIRELKALRDLLHKHLLRMSLLPEFEAVFCKQVSIGHQEYNLIHAKGTVPWFVFKSHISQRSIGFKTRKTPSPTYSRFNMPPFSYHTPHITNSKISLNRYTLASVTYSCFS